MQSEIWACDHSGIGVSVPSLDCAKCWDAYNKAKGLPSFNRLDAKRFKWRSKSGSKMVNVYEKSGEIAWHLKGLKAVRVDMVNVSDQSVMGIDLSLTSTGLAFVEIVNDELRYAVCSYGIQYGKKASSALKMRRLHVIASWVASFGHMAREIVIEDHAPSRAAFGGLHLAELHGAVKFALLDLGYDCGLVGVKEARAKVVLNGACPKDDVTSIIADHGFRFDNDDESDAIVIALSMI